MPLNALYTITFTILSFILLYLLGLSTNCPGHTSGKEGEKMEKKQQEQKPNWEMVDPKPPVIRCGHMENRKEH